jgi:hypothetical protein
MIMQRTEKLDEMLRLFALESAKEADDDTAAAGMNHILNQDALTDMGTERRRRMIAGLTAVAVDLSFGHLLRAEMERAAETPATLALKTRLPEVVIAQLLSDSIYTNNVPIMMLKDLLQSLHISFQTTEQAIRSTFLRLKARVDDELFSGSGAAAVPAYRKGNFLSKASTGGSAQGNGKDLFENEQVMEKYLKRLKELIAE